MKNRNLIDFVERKILLPENRAETILTDDFNDVPTLNDEVIVPAEKETASRDADARGPVPLIAYDLILDDDIIDLGGKEAASPPVPLSAFPDDLTLNNNDIIDLGGKETPDDLTLNNNDIFELGGKETASPPLKAVPLCAFPDDLTLNDDDIIDIDGKKTESPRLDADAEEAVLRTNFNFQFPNFNLQTCDFADDLTLNDNGSVISLSFRVRSSAKSQV